MKFACNLPDHAVSPNPFSANGLTFDEISLWSRPISFQEFSTMLSNFGNNVHSQAVPPTIFPPGQEQGVSLAVHLLESANADLALVHDYVQAERGVSYPECFTGGASPARDRAMARAGRNLRLVSVLAWISTGTGPHKIRRTGAGRDAAVSAWR